MPTRFALFFRYRNFLELCIAVLVSMLGFGLIMPLLPIYGREMGASGIYLGLLTSLFGITRSMISFPAGFLADKLGRKRLIVTGLFIYTVVMFLFGISTHLYQLLILRACQGAASGIVWPVAATMVADIVPPKDRGKAMGVFSMMWDAGIAVGPVLGGLLTAFFSISVPFFVCSSLSFLSALLVLKRVKETHSELKKKSDTHFDFNSFDKFSLLGMCITGFTISFALGMIQPILPLFGNEVLNLDEASIGVIFGAIGFTRFLVKPSSGALGDSVGRKKIVAAGLIFDSVSTTAIAFSTNFLTMMAACVAHAAGLGMTMPSMDAMVTSLTTRENRGKVMGIFSASKDMGLVAGPLLGGITFDTISVQAPFFMCGAVAFLGALILPMIIEPEK